MNEIPMICLCILFCSNMNAVVCQPMNDCKLLINEINPHDNVNDETSEFIELKEFCLSKIKERKALDGYKLLLIDHIQTISKKFQKWNKIK